MTHDYGERMSLALDGRLSAQERAELDAHLADVRRVPRSLGSVPASGSRLVQRCTGCACAWICAAILDQAGQAASASGSTRQARTCPRRSRRVCCRSHCAGASRRAARHRRMDRRQQSGHGHADAAGDSRGDGRALAGDIARARRSGPVSRSACWLHRAGLSSRATG